VFLECKAILKLPGDLNQAPRPWVVLGLVDLSDRFLEAIESLFEFSMRFWVVVDGCMAAEVVEEERVLADSLDGLVSSALSVGIL